MIAIDVFVLIRGISVSNAVHVNTHQDLIVPLRSMQGENLSTHEKVGVGGKQHCVLPLEKVRAPLCSSFYV